MTVMEERVLKGVVHLCARTQQFMLQMSVRLRNYYTRINDINTCFQNVSSEYETSPSPYLFLFQSASPGILSCLPVQFQPHTSLRSRRWVEPPPPPTPQTLYPLNHRHGWVTSCSCGRCRAPRTCCCPDVSAHPPFDRLLNECFMTSFCGVARAKSCKAPKEHVIASLESPRVSSMLCSHSLAMVVRHLSSV